MECKRFALSAIASGFLTCFVSASWHVVVLPNSGSAASFIYGVSETAKFGYVGSPPRATMWDPTNNRKYFDWDGAAWTVAICGSPAWAGGAASYGGITRAAAWNIDSGIHVDLHPFVAEYSEILGGSDTSFVGRIRYPAAFHAVMWTVPGFGFVDLHPPERPDSFAYASDEIQQVGWTRGNADEAALWTGTSSSWVSLGGHGFSNTQAYGVNNGQQVGSGYVNGKMRALTWQGSAESVQDISPDLSGYEHFQLTGTTGEYQSGMAQTTGNKKHAAVWRGSKASFLDLHSLLPSGYGTSFATSIAALPHGGVIVGGYAYDTNDTAVYWYKDAPVTVNCKVKLDDYNGSIAGKTVFYKAFKGETLSTSGTALLNGQGAFQVVVEEAGAARIEVKVSHWLSRSRNINLVAPSISPSVIALTNGDVDGDDVVSVFDYLILSEAFDSSIGDGQFKEDADLDGDGSVSLFDYLILNEHFDESGG